MTARLQQTTKSFNVNYFDKHYIVLKIRKNLQAILPSLKLFVIREF